MKLMISEKGPNWRRQKKITGKKKGKEEKKKGRETKKDKQGKENAK